MSGFPGTGSIIPGIPTHLKIQVLGQWEQLVTGWPEWPAREEELAANCNQALVVADSIWPDV